MSKNLWNEVHSRIASHDYMAGIERKVDRVKATGEIFTPTDLVVEMLKLTPMELFEPGKKILDPACGDGQFLVGAKWAKVLLAGMSEEDALLDIFGVDIMRDNVDICKARLFGGTILMGDVLNPEKKLEKQTKEEHKQMLELFTNESQFSLFEGAEI